MQVKRYTGPDLRSTLARVRAELGPDALVLSHRDLPLAEGGGAEIVAGLERTEPRAAAVQGALQRLAARVRADTPAPALPARSRRAPADFEVGRPTTATPSPARSATRPDPLEAPLLDVRRALQAAGFDEAFTARFENETRRDLGNRRSAQRLARACERAMERTVSLDPLTELRGTTILVGPPGAGKTTSSLKLTASHADVRAVLVPADRFSPHATLAARHLGELHGVDLAPVSSGDTLRSLVRGQRRRPLVVDTCGAGRADDDRLDYLHELREAAPSADVTVVVPCGLAREELVRTLERFAPLQPTSIAITRLDDGACIGPTVSAAAEAGLPLSFVTHGHRIPGDWRPATGATLAGAALRALGEEHA